MMALTDTMRESDIRIITGKKYKCSPKNDDAILFATTGGVNNRPGGASAESSPYFSRRRQNHHQLPERYQSCMTLPSDGLVEPLGSARDRVMVDVDQRGAATGSNGTASPRSITSAPCGLEDHQVGLSPLGLALPLGMTHSSPTASPQRMEWKVMCENC